MAEAETNDSFTSANLIPADSAGRCSLTFPGKKLYKIFKKNPLVGI